MTKKHISEEIKKLIVEAKQNGESVRVVAARFHVTIGAVSKICKKWREEGTVKRKRGSGRSRKTTERQNRCLIRLVKMDPFKTAVDVQNYAREHLGVEMAIRTARNILIRAGLCGRMPAKKPLMREKNRKARLAFARAHKDWTVEQWSRVLWSDESKKTLFGSDRIRFVRRPAGKRFKTSTH
jgi:transposase